jgi:hypothetical protein
MLGHDDQAAEAMRKSGLGAAPADARLMFAAIAKAPLACVPCPVAGRSSIEQGVGHAAGAS